MKKEGLWARGLKVIGAITAVVSLVVGLQQAWSRVNDSMTRRREAVALVDVARQQAARRAFTEAWKSLDRAEALGSSDNVAAARVDVAIAWLQDARPGADKPFSVITDAVTPALDRALLSAQGSRKADIQAYLGWVTFLRLRDGISGDPAPQYKEALTTDPANVAAHTLLGHWLMWNGSNVAAAREQFNAALAANPPNRDFVRRYQLTAIRNRSADDELIRVVNEMREAGEPLDGSMAKYVSWIYSTRYGPGSSHTPGQQSDAPPVVSPDHMAATYEWLTALADDGGGSAALTGYVRAVLQEAAGRREDALSAYRALQQRADAPPQIRDRARAAVSRLAKRPS